MDASIREVDDVRTIALPVRTRWRRVRDVAKEPPGAVDVPVTVGGQRIDPGDLMMDADGTGVVPLTRVGEVLRADRSGMSARR